MTPPPGKLRTRAHVLADLSINHVERQVLLCGCSVPRIYSDYGYDLIMSTFKPSGEIEGGNVFFQVKATDSLPLLADHKTISWVVSRRDLRLWLSRSRIDFQDLTVIGIEPIALRKQLPTKRGTKRMQAVHHHRCLPWLLPPTDMRCVKVRRYILPPARAGVL
jgi:hypothetical protein